MLRLGSSTNIPLSVLDVEGEAIANASVEVSSGNPSTLAVEFDNQTRTMTVKALQLGKSTISVRAGDVDMVHEVRVGEKIEGQWRVKRLAVDYYIQTEFGMWSESRKVEWLPSRWTNSILSARQQTAKSKRFKSTIKNLKNADLDSIDYPNPSYPENGEQEARILALAGYIPVPDYVKETRKGTWAYSRLELPSDLVAEVSASADGSGFQLKLVSDTESTYDSARLPFVGSVNLDGMAAEVKAAVASTINSQSGLVGFDRVSRTDVPDTYQGCGPAGFVVQVGCEEVSRWGCRKSKLGSYTGLTSTEAWTFSEHKLPASPSLAPHSSGETCFDWSKWLLTVSPDGQTLTGRMMEGNHNGVFQAEALPPI
jgi:hypothetical protein